VVWRRGRQFAMRFDRPVSQDEVETFSREAANARGLSPEMRHSLEVWMGGAAR